MAYDGAVLDGRRRQAASIGFFASLVLMAVGVWTYSQMSPTPCEGTVRLLNCGIAASPYHLHPARALAEWLAALVVALASVTTLVRRRGVPGPG